MRLSAFADRVAHTIGTSITATPPGVSPARAGRRCKTRLQTRATALSEPREARRAENADARRQWGAFLPALPPIPTNRRVTGDFVTIGLHRRRLTPAALWRCGDRGLCHQSRVRRASGPFQQGDSLRPG